MKHLLACVLALTAAAAFSPTDAVAGLARLDGSFAGAHLVTTSDDGCRQTTVSFNALDESRHEQAGRPTAGKFLILWVEAYDLCVGAPVFLSSAVHPLSPDAFAISARTGVATLDASLELADNLGSAQTMTLSFHVVWQATDTPWYDARSRWRSHDGGMFVLTTDAYELSDATILGSVSDGTTDYMNGAISGATLGETSQGLLVAKDSLASAARLAFGTLAAPETSRFSSDGVFGLWEAFDDTGCIRRLGIVSASAITVDSGEPRLDVYLDFSRWDHCLNQPLFHITSSDAIPLPPDALTIEPNFNGASLVATLHGIDQITGESLPLAVDLAWVEPGPATRVAGATRSVVNGVLYKAHDSYAYRSSQVAGSISSPAGNLIGGYPVGVADFVEASFGNQRTQARTAP